jgi:hypothetical protein
MDQLQVAKTALECPLWSGPRFRIILFPDMENQEMTVRREKGGDIVTKLRQVEVL